MSERHIGDQVVVTADNYGSPATIVDIRDGRGSPPSRYKVETAHDTFWAFDYEIEEAVMPDSTADTREHIAKVQARIHECTNNLIVRAERHDRSKLSEPELSGYAALTTALKDVQYGTDEYRAALAEAKTVITHHYAVNDHHPEHYENGITGMSLLSLLEMVADWKGASERTRQGSIEASLAHNKQRFGIDDQLFAILENTVKELGW